MELRSETFKILLKYNNWWTKNAFKKESKLLKDLDNIAFLAEKDKGNLEVSREKIKKFCKENISEKLKWHNLTNPQNERLKQFFSFFAELMTYDELRKRNFTDIKFLREAGCQSDLNAKKEEKNIFIEVKRKRLSKSEEETVKSGKLYDGSGPYNEALKKSVEDFIKDALKKFNAVSAKEIQHRILVIDFEPGDGTQFIIETKQPTLANVLTANYFKGLKKKFQITIWTANYFSKYDKEL